MAAPRNRLLPPESSGRCEATNVFLSLHSGQTLLVLPSASHRGRDLGLFNLTNTVPSLIMPWLTVMVVPERGFPALFGMLAVLAFASSGMLFMNPRLNSTCG